MKFNRLNYWTHRESTSEIETFSLAELLKSVLFAVHNAELNHKDPEDVPVYVKFDNEIHELCYFTDCFGSDGMSCEVETSEYNKIKYIAPDKRPEEGEYWRSRGIGTGGDGVADCSGFVESKPAGERLRRMVNLVLEKDETDSWLDYREREPNYIQYKFSGNEFDLEKLHKLSKENKNIVTLEILKQCKI